MKSLIPHSVAVAVLSLASLQFAWAAGGAQGDVAAAAKQKADQLCASCHGADGKTPVDPSYPILAGQYADYLVVALKAYKSGARKNPIMAGMAGPLTSAEINALAAHYSSLPGPLSYER
ncbi:MAG: c-type cytochrome [Burkholderiaceae bacterium]